MADDKPTFERRPTFPVVYAPEDLPVLDWLDEKVSVAAKAARAAGGSVREANRSKMIWHLLRAIMEAERAAVVSPSPTEAPPKKAPTKKPRPSRAKSH